MRLALGYARHAKRTKEWYWAPPGAYGYPPDKQEKATQTVLEQAEVLSAEWALA